MPRLLTAAGLGLQLDQFAIAQGVESFVCDGHATSDAPDFDTSGHVLVESTSRHRAERKDANALTHVLA